MAVSGGTAVAKDRTSVLGRTEAAALPPGHIQESAWLELRASALY